MTKKKILSQKEKVEKDIQKKLAQAQKLLNECAKLADEHRLDIAFNGTRYLLNDMTEGERENFGIYSGRGDWMEGQWLSSSEYRDC